MNSYIPSSVRGTACGTASALSRVCVALLDVLIYFLTLLDRQWWDDRTHRGRCFTHDRSFVPGIRKYCYVFVVGYLCAVDQRGQWRR